MSSNEKNHTPLTKMLISKASALKVPISGTFELSPVCNFSCRMCYVRKSAKEVQNHTRPMVTKEQWLRFAREAREQGMLFLLLTGGEPLLWPDFWSLYEELSEMGFLISINTNGSLIDEEAIRRLKAHPPKRINLTLYGAGDESYEALCGVKGMFDRIHRTIQKLKEAGILVKLNCSLTPANQKDMEAIMTYAKEQDLVLEMASYMFPPVRRKETEMGDDYRFTPEEYGACHLQSYRLQNGEEQYRRLLEGILQRSAPPPGLGESCKDPADGKIRCRAGKASFWITWDGLMLPCGMMPRNGVDLYEKDFPTAWNEVVSATEKIRLSSVCSTCKNRGLCHTCAAIAMAETGSTEKIPAYLCKAVEIYRQIAKRELAQELMEKER